MTDLSRGTPFRRGGRRPGWLLLTVLLVLAIAASSALVFTERVELLKLAVILALWAAAAAAFASVIYRRQSDADRARARDMKLVYDLQLDREISARREYELEVESQLRRELSSELREQAAEEVGALRAELAALRNNLEIIFETDLSHRPAIETEHTTVRAYSDWQRDGARFVASAPRQAPDDTGENAIIDVPEEPPAPDEEARRVSEPQPPPAPEPVWVPPRAEPVARGEARHSDEWQPVGADGQWLPPGTPGSSWVSTNGTSRPSGPVAAEPRPGRHWSQSEPVGAPPGPPSGRHTTEQNRSAAPNPPPPPPPQRVARHGASDDESRGQSVAELLARLQTGAEPSGGGRRRRRDGG